MQLTRESALWWVGVISAIVAGLSTLDPAAAAALGLPTVILPYLRLYALVAGIGSAWAKTSPFPSKKDEPSSGSIAPGRTFPPAAVIFLALALGAGAVTSTSCATAPPPALSPAGVSAFNALRVGHALDLIRDTAVDASKQSPPLISHADLLKIVNWHEAAVKTIVAVPGGWKPTVLAGLDQLQSDIPAAEWQKIALYAALLKTVISEVP